MDCTNGERLMGSGAAPGGMQADMVIYPGVLDLPVKLP